MAIIINLTPHSITIFAEGSVELQQVPGSNYKSLVVKAGEKPAMEIPPSGIVARAAETLTTEEPISVNGLAIPMIHKVMGKPQDLPEPKEDTLYLVSLATAKAAPDRKDLLVVGESCRDLEGHIRGCVSLARP